MMRFALFVIAAAVALGQPKSNSDLSTAARVDYSGALTTKPVKVGASNPANCGAGELFFNTAATTGQKIKGCESTDTWVTQGGGGGGGSTLTYTLLPAGLLDNGLGGGMTVVDTLYQVKVATYVNASTNHSTWWTVIPAAWTGVAPAVRISWTNATSNSSNTYKWNLTSSCDATGSAPTYNTAAISTVNDTTTAFVPSVTSSTLPITGCSAGNLVRIRLLEGTTFTSTAAHFVYGLEVIWPLTP